MSESSISYSTFLILSIVISISYVFILGLITYYYLVKNNLVTKIISKYCPNIYSKISPKEDSGRTIHERNSVYERRRINMEKEREQYQNV